MNNNDEIDYTEFVTACMKKKRADLEAILKETFDMFDIDKNGKITLDELKDTIGASL